MYIYFIHNFAVLYALTHRPEHTGKLQHHHFMLRGRIGGNLFFVVQVIYRGDGYQFHFFRSPSLDATCILYHILILHSRSHAIDSAGVASNEHNATRASGKELLQST